MIFAVLSSQATDTRASTVPITFDATEAVVIDGDKFMHGDQTIRLHGIDAPETGQRCQGADGRAYQCGIEAKKHFQSLLEQGAVVCQPRETDSHGRLIAVCRIAGKDLAASLVSAGWAVAFRKFSQDYAPHEREARQARRGLWAGEFQAPEVFRAERWQASGAPDPDCPIKGNVGRDGKRIYHAPWSRWYDRTKIDTTSGERWFCDEGEAMRAGWRAPRR